MDFVAKADRPKAKIPRTARKPWNTTEARSFVAR